MSTQGINFSELFFAAGFMFAIIIVVLVATLALASRLNPRPTARGLEMRKSVWRVLSRLSILVALLFVLGILSGCAGDPAKPRTAAEMFPINCGTPIAEGVVREKGPVGLILNTGTAPSQVCVFDQANHLIERWYVHGANRFITGPNNQPYAIAIERRLDPGCYRLDIYSFYKKVLWVPPRIETWLLQKQTQNVCTGNNPFAHLVNGKPYSWQIQLTANIPDGATGMPLFQINLPLN